MGGGQITCEKEKEGEDSTWNRCGMVYGGEDAHFIGRVDGAGALFCTCKLILEAEIQSVQICF